MPSRDATDLPAARVALIGLLGLAAAMGIGRFAFTPLLPLMQAGEGLTLTQGGWLAGANYFGYLLGALACAARPPQPARAARWGLVGVAAFTLAMAALDGFAMRWLLRFGAGASSALVLVGVSRVGKTPTCLYMALHYGVKAANYPLTEEDLEKLELPKRLAPHRPRLYGLSIDPVRLAQVREARRPGSRYAKVEQCRWELEQADKLFRREGIAVQNTTHTSIEEISSKILSQLGIEKHMF